MNTPLNSKEHHEMMLAFERQAKSLPVSLRFEHEPRSFWPNGYVYQDGLTNQMFLAYRLGYAQGAAVAALTHPQPADGRHR